jgi:RES domain
LHRVHDLRYAPPEFNPTPQPDPYVGGRFDSIDGSYSYLYAGGTEEVAIAEALLRHMPLADLVTGTQRVVPAETIRRARLSSIEVLKPIEVVCLAGPGLSAIGQDAWLTSCDAAEYIFTRSWAKAIRGWAPSAAGFVWRSRVDNDLQSFVFFGDRIPIDAMKKHKTIGTRSTSGRARVESALAKYNAFLS